MIMRIEHNIQDKEVVQNAIKYLKDKNHSFIVELATSKSSNFYTLSFNVLGKVVGMDSEKVTIKFDRDKLKYNDISESKLANSELLFIINRSLKSIKKVFLKY